jgi:hypothetical protein
MLFVDASGVYLDSKSLRCVDHPPAPLVHVAATPVLLMSAHYGIGIGGGGPKSPQIMARTMSSATMGS